MSDCWIDCIFGDIALHTHIVIFTSFFGQASTLYFHLMRSLPRPNDNLANTSHCLTIRCNDRKRAHIMQNILSRDRLTPDATLGKGYILWNRFIQMVTDHQHIEMFFQRVDGIGARWVG